MNTANKLTILRVVMIPAFLLVLYLEVPNANYWALAIFAAASLDQYTYSVFSSPDSSG